MTFQYKSLIPFMKCYVDIGYRVFILSNFKDFDINKLREKPRGLNCVNKKSLKFICDEILFDTRFLDKVIFLPYFGKLSFVFNFIYSLLNPIFISTTKGFRFLNQKQIINCKRVAVPYQNFKNIYLAEKKLFFPKDAKPYDGYEKELIMTIDNLKYFHMDLPYLRHINLVNSKINTRCKILFLHPGGYRNVVSNHGDGLSLCISKQKLMYEELKSCLVGNWQIDVKIHPLAAKFHDYETNSKYLSDTMKFINDPLLEVISNYEIIVSFGSSSYYELKYFNKPYFNLAFMKNERSDLYKNNSSITLNTKEEFKDVLLKKHFRNNKISNNTNQLALEKIMNHIIDYDF